MKSFFRAYTLPFLVLLIGLVMYYVMFIKSNERYSEQVEDTSSFTRHNHYQSNDFEDSNLLSEFFSSIKRIVLNSNPNEYPKEEINAHFTQNTDEYAMQGSQEENNDNPQQNFSQESIQYDAQSNSTQDMLETDKNPIPTPLQNLAQSNPQPTTQLSPQTPETSQIIEPTKSPKSLLYYTTTRLNVRKEPSINAPLLSRLASGEKVKVIKFNDEWAQLENGGWVSAKLLTLEQEDSSLQDTQMYTSLVNANIRQKPDNDSPIVGSVLKGERVRVRSVSNGWARTLSGGYIALRLLQKDSD